MQKISKERIENVARIYKNNQYASEALGIATSTFGRLCRQYSILTPAARRKKNRQRACSSVG